MPTFLTDPPFTVYLVLAAAFFVAFAVWFGNRSRKSLAALGAVVAVIALLLLIDALCESLREESVRRAMAMVKAADTRDPEAFLSHVADKIEYQGESVPVTVTKAQLRNSQMWGVLKQYNAHVAAWDFSHGDVKLIDDDTVEIGFLAKGEANGQQAPMYFRAKFARQTDGQMKLVALASFDALKRVNERKSIPFFP
jgi:hypothetical protein